jgi:hypothetical protein
MNSLKLVLCATAAVLVAGFLVWKAEATPLTGSVDPSALGGTYLPVVKAACMFGTTRCPAGKKWSCSVTQSPKGDRKFCHCRPC